MDKPVLDLVGVNLEIQYEKLLLGDIEDSYGDISGYDDCWSLSQGALCLTV